jgi:hypothetical protein
MCACCEDGVITGISLNTGARPCVGPPEKDCLRLKLNVSYVLRCVVTGFVVVLLAGYSPV